MKNKHRLNVLIPPVMAVFILSLLLGIAGAETPMEQYKTAKEEYQQLKNDYDAAKQKFEDTKQQFNNAKEKVRSVKDNQSSEELKLKSKDYLNAAIDLLVDHLELLKSRAQDAENKQILPFDASANIDKNIAQLEDIRTKVEQANTTRELRDAAKELDDAWTKIKLEARYYSGIIINHRIDLFLVKTDNASARMDTLIQKLKDQGKDTSKLEKEKSSFDDLINEAKQSHQNDLALYESHKGFDSSGLVTNNQDAQAFLRDAANSQKNTVNKLKNANEHLRNFFKDARKMIVDKVVLRGTGKLEANGNGSAIIKGNVTVTVSGNVTLRVSSNADVTTDGTGTKEVLSNGDVKYQGYGSATITGENIKVEITGKQITLTVEGTGSAVLTGKGTYRTEKDFTASGDWTKE